MIPASIRIRRTGENCDVRTVPYQQLSSAGLYQEVLACGKRLDKALLEGQSARVRNSIRANDVLAEERWKLARKEVVGAVEYYTLALEKYREAVMSELTPRRK